METHEVSIDLQDDGISNISDINSDLSAETPNAINDIDLTFTKTGSENQQKGVKTLERKPCSGVSLDSANNYAANKNVAEGLMDIALLSANANQLRFLITYNHEASTYYISLGLVILSLVMQVVVGIALIFKRRLKHCNARKYTRLNECLIFGVFMVTVINILLAAFTTTDGH